jgi:hypothetical protein
VCGVCLLALLLRAPPARGQIIGQNFTGSTRVQLGFIPPDTMGAVGPSHFAELVNGRFAVYDKTGANNPDGTRTPVLAKTLNQFWTDAGVTPQGAFAFDPRIVYDPTSGRWFASSADNIRAANRFLVAVSDSADPTGPWHGFGIDSEAANTRWADFPTLGFNSSGVYLSANMLDVGGGVGNQQTTIVAIPKTDLLAPSPSVANARLFENLISTAGTSVQPLANFDSASPTTAFVSFAGPLRRTDLVGTIASGSITGPTILNAIDSLQPPPTADQADNFTTGQQTPKANIYTLDQRITANAVLRGGVIWGVQTGNVGGRAALQWFKIRASDNQVLQTGIISDPSLSYYYGSISVNEFGDVVIGASGSGADTFVSSYAFVGNSAGDDPTGATTFGAPLLLKAGIDDYQRLDSTGRNRWGDYSATTPDPGNPFSFWTVQEFVSADNEYSLQVTQILIPEPSCSAILLFTIKMLVRRRR